MLFREPLDAVAVGIAIRGIEFAAGNFCQIRLKAIKTSLDWISIVRPNNVLKNR
jgi:hypothetical protein